MNITIGEKDKVKLEDIFDGDVFSYKDCTYMKLLQIMRIDEGEYQEINCVDLECGTVEFIETTTDVTPIIGSFVCQ